MKTKFTLAFLVLLQISLFGQCPVPSAFEFQDGNQIKALVSNAGNLFNDGSGGLFIAPANDLLPKSTIYTAGLWLGGFDSGGNLKLAAQTYRLGSNYDYAPGPLQNDGTADEELCQNFNKIWKVSKEDIELHKADFADNGIIDNPIASIFAWPGRNNIYSFPYNGFLLPDMETGAPFYNQNADNRYNPDQGDYPHPPHTIPELAPASMTWSVFNDNTTHYNSDGVPIIAEVHLTTWSFDCFANSPLNKSIFTSHKIINKSTEALDSFHVTLWVDFDLGCPYDDFMGSYLDQNAFFAYNSDNLDGVSSPFDCFVSNTYGDTLPAQSIQFLNKELSSFSYYNSSSWGPPIPVTNPSNPEQIYNYMSGKWSDGSPMTYGGTGYDPTSTDYTKHAFPDNPNDSSGWSMYQADMNDGDRMTMASYNHGTFSPNEAITIDMAYTFHRYPNISDFLEIVDQMYPEIEQIQQMYDMEFNSWCGIITDTEEVIQEKIEISPNPSTGIFNLKTDNIEIRDLKLFDVSGRLLWQNTADIYDSKNLDFGFLDNGIYILQVAADDKIFSKKLILNK